MFLGLGIRDRDRNVSTCWPELEFGYKVTFLTIIISTIIFVVIPQISLYFPNMVERTVENFELWRLISSFLIHGTKVRAILNSLFNVYVLYISMPDIERQFSTAYVIIEFFKKILTNNALLVLIGYPLYYYEVVDSKLLMGYGILSINFSFMWHRVSQSPNEPARFCFFPCNIPAKYVPWSFLILQIAFNNPIIPIIIYCLHGYFQFMVVKKSFIQFPLAVYKKFDALIPRWISNVKGYIKVVNVQEQLKSLCSNGCCWASNDRLNQTTERVEVIGDGISIGGRNTAPQTFWSKTSEFPQEEIAQNKKEQTPSHQKQEQQEQPQFKQQILQDNSTVAFDVNPNTDEVMASQQSAPVESSSKEEPQYYIQY